MFIDGRMNYPAHFTQNSKEIPEDSALLLKNNLLGLAEVYLFNINNFKEVLALQR